MPVRFSIQPSLVNRGLSCDEARYDETLTNTKIRSKATRSLRDMVHLPSINRDTTSRESCTIFSTAIISCEWYNPSTMTSPTTTRRPPLSIAWIGYFFLFGALMLLFAGFTLVRPGTPLDLMWRLNP